MRRWLILSVTGLTFLTAAALARQGSVRTRDGKIYEGDVREGQQNVQVSRGTIQVQVSREQVVSITYTGETLEVMQGRLKELKPDDLSGRLTLARDAFRGGYYDFARQVTTQVLDKDPNNKAAVDLLDLIRRQVLLEAKRAAVEAGTLTSPEAGPAGAPAPAPLPRAYLTDVEINLVKQAELQPADAGRVRIRLENDVARRYLALPQANPAFAEGAPFDQAMILIQSSDSLRRDVTIFGDPGSIREFRQGIQRFVLNSCATSACHGTFSGGRFILFPSGDYEPAAYTNFYLLASYQRKGPGNDKGVFGGVASTRKMIDRLTPGHSLLLQYGLPEQIALTPHPLVDGFRPAFTSENDPQFRRVADWISRSLSPQEPVYPIHYTPPAPPAPSTRAPEEAATRPTAAPVPDR